MHACVCVCVCVFYHVYISREYIRNNYNNAEELGAKDEDHAWKLYYKYVHVCVCVVPGERRVCVGK
jgi:hypothetical protein